MGPGNGDITVYNAIETMKTSGQKNRMEGVANLKMIFEQNSKSSNLDALKDGAYHSIFEALFTVAQAEKQGYIVAKNSTTRSKAERSLEACSDVLRITIRAGAEKLKKKTVKAIIEHVTQLLPVANGEYCAGLSQFYLKVLGALLEHEAHVEQLDEDDWMGTVDFCLQGINNYDRSGFPEEFSESHVSTNTIVPAYSSSRNSISKLSVRTASSRSSVGSVTRRNSEELLQCLRYLVSATNAPILARVEEILQGIMHFLLSHGFTVSPIHQVAFSALNFTLSATNTDRAFLLLSLVPDLVPIIGRLWSSKSLSKDEMLNSVKDEMLVTILILRLHMERIVTDNSAPGFENKIEELESVLRNDYMRRTDRDQLQLDDLDLGTMGIDLLDIKSAIQIGNLRLRPHAARVERKWAILKSLCVLDELLHLHPTIKGQARSDDEGDELRHPRKRRRVAQQMDGIALRVSSLDKDERLVALQTLLFMLPIHQLPNETLNDLINVIMPCLSDKRGEISSWALLVFAFCSQQDASRSCLFEWVPLWHTVARLVTNSTTCRAACVLLHSMLACDLVLYKEIAEDVDLMVTVTNIDAPVVLCDASLSLMAHLLRIRNTEIPGGSLTTSHHVLRWLSAKWSPDEKPFAARCAIDVHPIDTLNIIRTCLALPLVHLSPSQENTLGIIGQAWMQQSSNEDTLRYLLLLRQSPVRYARCLGCTTSHKLYDGDHLSDNSTQGLTTKRLIIDLFQPKFETLLREWESYITDDSAHISTDSLRCSTSAIILGSLLISLVFDERLRQISDNLENMLSRLSNLILQQLSINGESLVLFETLLQEAHPYLSTKTSSELNNLCQYSPLLKKFFSSIANSLPDKFSSSEESVRASIEDSMDLDDIFDTQHSRSRSGGTNNRLSRRSSTLEVSSKAFYSVVSARLVLVSTKPQTSATSEDMPSAFVDYILSLKTVETLLCSQLIRETLPSKFFISLSDASRLVEHVGGIISSSAFDSCEVALNLCLNVLTGLVPVWATLGVIGDLPDSARQLYEWFVMVVLPKRRPSFNVEKELVNLLFELIRIQPTFGEEFEEDQLPSVQSCLFSILRKSSMPIKFHIAQRLPEMFELFLLKDHSKILSDVIESLPVDPDWTEGIAFRLHVLSLLASRWPTLIRQCAYYILEVPGTIPSAVRYATRCVANISKALELDDSKALFQLFASQLLYTWLAIQPISKIPYEVFGYDSLRGLAHDSQAEIVGLMTMRSQEEEVDELIKLLETSHKDILQNCFTKVIAYSVAHDISVPRVNVTKKYVSGETRVRKCLGRDLFFELVNKYFADIIALLFHLIDQEEQVEKSLLKTPALTYAASIMADIKSMGSSGIVLPPNQQPAFKAKYLTSEIEHLCSRTEYDMGSLYSPSMAVFVARSLLNTTHPALGSLHACAVLRKIRMLIALSGATAINGYPLEMLLHSLRPFIIDSECADDAIGIAQYLLHRGLAYLSTAPSFVIGISLSVIASLRGFLDSTPSSTTQQSQYRLTLSKAQAFHDWLGSYLAKYETQALSGQSRVAFRSLGRAAHGFRSVGNADRGTEESSLLRDLLEDERSGRRLLNKSSRNLAVSRLYGAFTQPRSFRSDILGVDADAVAFAPTLWELCRDANLHGPFLIWAGKVLGRAFAATGLIHKQLKQESTLRRMLDPVPPSVLGDASKLCVLRLLQTLTLEGNRQTAGLAEAALRLIVSMPGLDPGEFSGIISESLLLSSTWTPFQIPISDLSISETKRRLDPYTAESLADPSWAKCVTISLVKFTSSDAVLYALQQPLINAKGFAEEAFPFIVHLVLAKQLEGPQDVKSQFSGALKAWLSCEAESAKPHLKLIINTLLYLRTQHLPREKTSADRTNWLEINYIDAAKAAYRCGMTKTALLFFEISVSESARTSRRSSLNKISKPVEPDTLLFSIFKNIDDPDVFYGLQQKPDLDTILARLEYERDGFKSMAFRGAKYDTHLRQNYVSSAADSQALVNALGFLSLDGVSHSLLQVNQAVSLDTSSVNSMFQTARKLEQWDLPVPETCDDGAVTIYKTFQAIITAVDRESVSNAIDEGLKTTMSKFILDSNGAGTVHDALQSLAVLTEMDEALSASNSEEFEEMLGRFQSRKAWMKTGKFEDVNHILSCRETVLSSMSRQVNLRRILNINASETRLVEVQTTLLSSHLNRAHGALQEGLKSATYLASLVEPCLELGLNIEAAARLEAANALWEQGEMASSIGMLQDLGNSSILGKQTVPIGKPDLLAKIGYQVSVARLEKPDRIIEKYLNPALKELKGKTRGKEAGQVFHEFAVFCDQQLQDADTIEDLNRIRTLKEMKESEVRDLNKMFRSATTSEQKHRYHGFLVKAKQWLQLDSEEYERLYSSSNELLRRSLENYLLSLTASDEHDNDALRFTALWLQMSGLDMVNESVEKFLGDVPSYKFASLMNQLTSRLLDSAVKFQQLLLQLVLNICIDHPFHGMYQICAGSKTKSNAKDETAVSRQAATSKVGLQLASNARSAKVWGAINSTSRVYCQLASEKDETKYKQGQKIHLRDSHAGTTLNTMLPRFPVPPPTMQIKIVQDLNYSHIPLMVKLEPQISIASGVSAPKIITVIANDGVRYKQLVKGGNDDLRQDAIMEQVFSQVSELLAANTSTRQRNLGIRTYKVLPLSPNAGIIEFVSNTIPLHDYLMPAHERYYPKGLRGQQCRKEISDVQTQRLEVKIKKYRAVTDQFQPVMRYFFMEKFYDPDDWFARRLAYTRSTAAISMLGHVLGLGDRHGHNILLDEKTGEVVHIDLGVAFEMGRVLPVPEVVPFRLTRDIVDGMGITKTEGVYRRCCEFTLEALRKEAYSIMTILDVLRYDPLYSWSISPVRLAKLQNAQSAAPALDSEVDAMGGNGKARVVVNEPGEADRALTVVKKKLSKTLSVTATVNDLLNQATDERNLAALYSGWAAYA